MIETLRITPERVVPSDRLPARTNFNSQAAIPARPQEESLRLIMEGTANKTGHEFFRSCARYMAEVLQVKFALITEVNKDNSGYSTILAIWSDGKFLENTTYRIAGTPCEAAIFKGQAAFFPDRVTQLYPEAEALKAVGVESYLGIPLINSTDKILGHLAVMDNKPMQGGQEDREVILRIFAARAGAELERIQTERGLHHRAKIDGLQSNIARNLIDQEISVGIASSLQLVGEFLQVERVYLFEYGAEKQSCCLVEEWHDPDCSPFASSMQDAFFQQGNCWFHQTISSNQPIKINHLDEIPAYAATEKTFCSEESIQSFIAVPVIHREQVVGFFGADVVTKHRIWEETDIFLLKRVGELLAMGRSRARAEMALREAKDAAEAANRAKSTFLANMSHELRTPLNAILGFAQLMQHNDNLDSQQQNFVGIINRSGNHLLNLINDVLEMSKIEAGKIVLMEADFDLAQLLQSLQEMLQVRAMGKGLTLNFEIDPQLPSPIYADEGKLRQVLINLLGNAIKFTDSGRVTLRAQLVEQGRNQAILKFEIEDTGPGIAAEDRLHLFDPFIQVGQNTHKYQGTGLGLTISRQFITLMGGDIEVTSELGVGSCFSFSISVTLSDEIPVVSSQIPAKRVKALENLTEPCRILIVDDTPENCHLLECLLAPVGFELKIANEGETAIALWESWQPHLIWMDMRMPGIDGYEATRQIRQREKSLSPSKPTVIIALTASAFEEERGKILGTGCDDLVSKPFVESLIFEKLTEYLGIEYIYESGDTDLQHLSAPDSQGIGETVFTLNQLSPSVREQIRQSALAVDGEQIMALLQEQIPENQGLISTFAQLVDNFEFDEILALLETIPT